MVPICLKVDSENTSSSEESLERATGYLHGAKFSSEPWSWAGEGDSQGLERDKSVKAVLQGSVVAGYQVIHSGVVGMGG